MNKNEFNAYRARKNYSIEDIAKILGCSARTVANKIKDDSFTSADIKKLMTALDLDVQAVYEIFLSESVK